MTGPGDGRTPVEGAVTVLLPDDWARIELTDDSCRRADVADVVERSLGRADEWAQARRGLRETLDGSSAAAAAAGGLLMAVSLMRVDGIPVPASVTVFLLPGERLEARGAAVLAASAGADAVELTEAEHGVVLRRVRGAAVRTEVAALVGESGPQAVESFVADYWVEPTGAPAIVYLAFASPLGGARDALVELFDAVAGSVRVVGGKPAEVDGY